MNLSVLLIFIVGVAGLFYLDRDNSARASNALWLPVIWIWINGGRPVSVWLGMGTIGNEAGSQLPASSAIDELVAAALILLGIIVLVRRRRNTMLALKASWPIVLYFSYSLVSVLWSDFSGWGFKRWIRAAGELAIVLVVVTDAQPAAALRRVLSRVGFVLLPASVLLIKYFPEYGRNYDQWGSRTYTGVTTNKNALGVLVLVVALGALWQILRLWRDRKSPHRNRRLLAQGTLLLFGLNLLHSAGSATATACFVIGSGLMLAFDLTAIKRHRVAVHVLVGSILFCGGLFALLGGEAAVARALGRKPDLTGRTVVWETVIPMAPNALVGAGFETFWLGPRARAVNHAIGYTNEAHNGYIEVYLNLGLIGVGLIALILVHGYLVAVAAYRRDQAFGALLTAYVFSAAFYSISEAGFRMLNPIWFFLLFAVTAASRLKAVKVFPSPPRQRATVQTSLWATALPPVEYKVPR